jgi:acetyltransferase-like isoleucine patch superfamily enzyme
MTTKILSRLSEYRYFPQWRFAQYQLNQKAKTTNAFICRGNIQLTIADNCVIDKPENPCFIGQFGGSVPKNLVTVIQLGDSSHLSTTGSYFFRGVNISLGNSATLRIETGTYINSRTKIYSGNSITIGKNCAISFDVIIMDDDGHGFGSPPYSAPIVIEDDVWIGCRAMILKGVTIGKGSVVAAGAVVTKSCPPNSLIGGVPAKLIREGVSWTDELRIKASQSTIYE